MGRPVVSLVASVAVLIAAAVPFVGINTGFAGVSTLPDSRVQARLRGPRRASSRSGDRRRSRSWSTATSPPRGPGRHRAARARASPRIPPSAGPSVSVNDAGDLALIPCCWRATTPRALRRRRGRRCATTTSRLPSPAFRARGARGRRRGLERRLLRDHGSTTRRSSSPSSSPLSFLLLDARLPLARRARQGDPHEPALGRRRLRAAGAGLPEGRRRRASSASSRSTRSRPGSRSSSSPSSSGSRWTTTSSCSAASGSTTTRPATTAVGRGRPAARRQESSPAPR